MSSDIQWDALVRSTPEFTDAQLEEFVATQGWHVSTDGRVEDFEAFRRPYDAPHWGDGHIHEEPRDVWARQVAAGHVYLDLEEACEVAKETRARRAGEARERERKEAGYIDWADPAFWDPPEPQTIVPRMILEGQVCEIYSPGGVGKSLLALDIALGLTFRGDTFGDKVVQATVLYLDRENSTRGLSKRVRSFGASRRDAKKLKTTFHYSLLGNVPSLDTPAGGKWLAEQVQKTESTCVVIDTMSKVVDGEENSNDTWKGLHNKTLVKLRAAGVTVILLDHVGKDAERGPRGGSAKRDNCDVMWSLELFGTLPTGEDLFVLTNRKDREGDFAGEGSKLYAVREVAPVLRHRWATDPEVVAATATASSEASEYEALVRDIASETPDVPYSIRVMTAAIRERRGSASDALVREAIRKLKDRGDLTEKGQWAGVARSDATPALRATQ